MSREERLPLWGITPKAEPDHAPFWGMTPKAEEMDVTPPWTVQAVPVKQEGPGVKQEGLGVKQEGPRVKQEGLRVKQEERPGQAAVKLEPDERKIRIRLVHPPDKPPWSGPVPRDEASAYQQELLPIPSKPREAPEQARPRRQARKPPPSPNEKRAVSARNYAAVEAERGDYGLIDMGMDQRGSQSVLVHVQRRHPTPWRVLAEIRPGATLKASPVSGGPPVFLRVRYTTPARYYSPGARITTLSLGVDSADWRCLRADAPRI
jgi:hypothetical protein